MESLNEILNCDSRHCHQALLYESINDKIFLLEQDLKSYKSESDVRAISLRAGITGLTDYRQQIAGHCVKTNDQICQPEFSEIQEDEKFVAKIYVSAVLNIPLSELISLKQA